MNYRVRFNNWKVRNSAEVDWHESFDIPRRVFVVSAHVKHPIEYRAVHHGESKQEARENLCRVLMEGIGGGDGGEVEATATPELIESFGQRTRLNEWKQKMGAKLNWTHSLDEKTGVHTAVCTVLEPRPRFAGFGQGTSRVAAREAAALAVMIRRSEHGNSIFLHE